MKRGSEDDNGDADDAFFDGGMSLGSSTGDMKCDSHEKNRPLREASHILTEQGFTQVWPPGAATSPPLMPLATAPELVDKLQP